MGLPVGAGRAAPSADCGGEGWPCTGRAGAGSGGSDGTRTIQGLNAVCSIYERAQGSDDSVGGSVRTDALRYSGVKCRISNARPSQLLLQQGFEVSQLVEVIVYPDAYPDIREQDIVIPQSGQWPDARLKVVSVQRSSLPPGHPRSHIQLFASRLRYADDNEPEA